MTRTPEKPPLPPAAPDPARAQERRAAILAEAVAALCHDLRGPLNAILGWTTILRRAAPDSMARGLEVVERNARLQAWMLEDLTEVYAVAGGVELTRREPFDVAALTAGVVDQARQSLRAEFVLGGADGGALRVVGDANVLRTGIRAVLTHFGRAHDVSTRVSVDADGGDVVVRFVEPKRGQFPFDGLEALARGEDGGGVFTRGAGLALLVAHHAACAHGGSVRPVPDGLAIALPRAT